nr:antitoxin [Arthrobacter silviterrae]
MFRSWGANGPTSEGRCLVSIFDDIKGKAEELIGSHGDQVKDGIEKAGDFVDDKTGGKFKDQVDGIQKAGSDYVDGQSQAGQ